MNHAKSQELERPAIITPFDNVVAPLIPTLLLVLFLFYIDEGWYSFRWMLNWGNWIVFVIYLVAIYPVFWLISRFVFKTFHGLTKLILIALLGIPLMMLLLFGLIF